MLESTERHKFQQIFPPTEVAAESLNQPAQPIGAAEESSGNTSVHTLVQQYITPTDSGASSSGLGNCTDDHSNLSGVCYRQKSEKLCSGQLLEKRHRARILSEQSQAEIVCHSSKSSRKFQVSSSTDDNEAIENPATAEYADSSEVDVAAGVDVKLAGNSHNQPGSELPGAGVMAEFHQDLSSYNDTSRPSSVSVKLSQTRQPAARFPVASAVGTSASFLQQRSKNKVEELADPSGFTCLSECSAMRCCYLSLYYLMLWLFTGLFTWVLLELSLSVTSRGKFPYYIASNSFCLISPGISFPAGNPEPGAVTEFGALNNLADSVKASLKERYINPHANAQSPKFRICGPDTAQLVDANILMQPCNLSAYANAVISKIDSLLNSERPAFFVLIRRQLGYIPTTGAFVEVTCTAKVFGGEVKLAYFNWSPLNSTLVESASSGQVSTLYFPMLSEWHSVPGVLLSVNSSVSKAVWSGNKMFISCQVSDGGSVRPGPREIILKIG